MSSADDEDPKVSTAIKAIVEVIRVNSLDDKEALNALFCVLSSRLITLGVQPEQAAEHFRAMMAKGYALETVH